MHLSSLLTSLGLAATVTAAGVGNFDDIYYLVDCFSSSNTQQPYSAGAYYWLRDRSLHGERPPGAGNVSGYGTIINGGAPHALRKWEGNQTLIVFPNTHAGFPGIKFTVNIVPLGRDVGNNNIAGDAITDNGRYFKCRLDGGRVLYSSGDVQCRTIYYCAARYT